MTGAHWGWAIIGVALLTYCLRAAPLLERRLRDLGARNVAFLSHVSFAIAAGIVSKALVVAGDTWAAPNDVIIKVIAVCAAIALYRMVRQLPIALFGGVGMAVLLKWWGF
jgi:branched-subunit amino acid transport protein